VDKATDLPPIAGRDEILTLLTASARKGHVGAMRLLLAGLDTDDEGDSAVDAGGSEDESEVSSIIDELAKRR
jgi:hypothetical protein